MKTAISIPDHIFEEAEATARRLGMSRSQLFARAVAEFIASHRGQRITDALDRVYDRDHGQVDPGLAELQLRSILAQDEP